MANAKGALFATDQLYAPAGPINWTSGAGLSFFFPPGATSLDPLYRFYDKAIVKKRRIKFTACTATTYVEWVAFWLPNTWKIHSGVDLSVVTMAQARQFPGARYGTLGNPGQVQGLHHFKFSSYPGKAQKMPDNSWTDYAQDIAYDAANDNWKVNAVADYYNEFYFLWQGAVGAAVSVYFTNIMEDTTVMLFERDDFEVEGLVTSDGPPPVEKLVDAVTKARKHVDPNVVSLHRRRHHHHHEESAPSTPMQTFRI